MFASLPNISSAVRPRDAFTQFDGGLDQETPAWSAAPGTLRDSLNYERAIEGGYRDISGYERFDGRESPSDASFSILDVTIVGSLSPGEEISGSDSGATAKVIAVSTYEDDPSQSYVVLTNINGAFQVGEDLTLGEGLFVFTGMFFSEEDDNVQATVDSEAYADSAPTPLLRAQYKNLAADEFRSYIEPVPGEGSVWGGFSLADEKFAIRNRSGGSEAGLYRGTAAGWIEVDLGVEIAFTSGGAYEIEPGDVITGATSGETATVERVQITSGTFGAGDAVGWLVLSGQTGPFQAENLDVGADLNVATIAGDSSANTLLPSGRLDYDISNFADPLGPERVYGADGVNAGWEFDGSVFAFIRTGMVADTPKHVAVHKNQLFFSFVGSVQHSSVGNPFSWSVILGAGEIATGFSITGLHHEPGAEGNASLMVACRQRIFMLYGNDSSDWNLVRYRKKVGAYEWTVQQVAYTLFLDDRGLTDFRTTQAFGNFDHAALSDRIRSLINAKRSIAVASCVVRDKNQYRIFFSDKTAIYVTMEGSRVMGMMPVTLGHEVTTIWSEENDSGEEEIYFGSDDGFVYQMERGTSFDGANIYAFLYTHFDQKNSLEWLKTYLAPVTVEAKGGGYAEITMGYDLDYGRAEVRQPSNQTKDISGVQGSSWDSAIMWDVGLSWDETTLIPSVALDLRGEGRNISWVIQKDSDYFEPLLLTGVHYRYLLRRQQRA